MDQTNKPLRVPPSFSVYAEEHGIFDLFKRLTCDLIVDKPTDPLSYAIDWLKKDNDQVPKIAIVGAPGSGKTSVSQILSKEIASILVNKDELLADEFSVDVLHALECIEEKKEVPDDVWAKLIIERLRKEDCARRGYVLDGFPQNRKQAIALQEEGIVVDHLVCLDADFEVLYERQSGKRVDPETGFVYHTTFDWPEDEEVQERLQIEKAISASKMREKMKQHIRNIGLVLSSYKHIKSINADQPKSDVFNQVLTFVNVVPRSNAPHTPKIILLGPTGSGKSTLASKLAEKYQIIDVECARLIKEHIAGETKLGLMAKEAFEKDVHVDNQVVLKMLTNRLSQLDASVRGWVLHGYPITRRQAESLTDAGYKANRVYFLDMPKDSILERLSYRRLDPITGERYHELYDPPQSGKVAGRCLTHNRDTNEAILKELDEYNQNQAELFDYYEELKPLHVNADQDHQTIMEYVESTIVNPLPRDLQCENDTF